MPQPLLNPQPHPVKSSRYLMNAVAVALIVGALAVTAAVIVITRPRTGQPAANQNANATNSDALIQAPVGPELAAVELRRDVTVSGTTVALRRAFQTAEYNLKTAATGQSFVVIEFEPAQGNAGRLANAVASAALRADGQDYHPISRSINEFSDSQAAATLVFTVPTGHGLLELRLGTEQIPVSLTVNP